MTMSSRLGSSLVKAARLKWKKKCCRNEWTVMSWCIIWRRLTYTELVGRRGIFIGRLVYELMTWVSACFRIHVMHAIEIAVMDIGSNHHALTSCL